MSLSKKETMAEIVRCGKDPSFFCKKYAKISKNHFEEQLKRGTTVQVIVDIPYFAQCCGLWAM